jgi:SAM-dependent methyltransferase
MGGILLMSISTQNVRHFVRERSMRARMALYRVLGDDHTDAYRRLMRYRIRAHGPDHAVGHHDSDFGSWQFWWLIRHVGLRPDDRVLDLGCGTGRLAKHLVPFLESGDYTGIDISPEALDIARERLPGAVRRDRAPTFVENDDPTFADVDGEVDLVWANSLLTHLPERDVVELLAHLPHVLADDGQAFLTFFDEPQRSSKDFGYTPSEIHDIARGLGVHVRIIPEESFDHPKGQRLLTVRKHSAVPDRYTPMPRRLPEEDDAADVQVEVSADD